MEWTKKVGHVKIPDFRFTHDRHPHLPTAGWELREVENKPRFNAFTRKLIALTYVKRCGLCGQTRRGTDPVWALNARVCSNCWRGNLISNQTLYHRYGVRLVQPLTRGGETFIETCFHK